MTRLFAWQENDTSDDAADEYRSVTMYGKAGIGQRYYFFRQNFKTYYVRVSEIVNAHREVEGVNCASCTAGDNLYIQRFIVELRSGEKIVTQLPGRREAEKMLSLTRERGIPCRVPGRDDKA